MMTSPSTPAFFAMSRAGALRDLRTMSAPSCSSGSDSVSANSCTNSDRCSSAAPPPVQAVQSQKSVIHGDVQVGDLQADNVLMSVLRSVLKRQKRNIDSMSGKMMCQQAVLIVPHMAIQSACMSLDHQQLNANSFDCHEQRQFATCHILMLTN